MTRLRAHLGAKLVLAHLLVIIVGVATLLAAALAVAPAIFARHLAGLPADPVAQYAHLTTAFRDALLQALALSAGVATAAAILTSLFVARRIAGPVWRMLVATRRIAAGYYTGRVPIDPATRDDELGQLAASFNAMAAALEATERRRLDLIGDVAHELRTPIATLEGYLEGLLDGVIAPTAPTWARLHGEVGRLRRLVDDLQELSRAEARQLPLAIRAASPATVVHTALDPLRGRFVEGELALRVSVPPDLPSVTTDPDRAAQVLTNLLTNALRYTPAPGRVDVIADLRDDVVAFRVADSGLGFTPEEGARLFERFYRADQSRARATGGAGVGLAIARALTEALGGELRAESPGPGCGSTFTLTLPLAR